LGLSVMGMMFLTHERDSDMILYMHQVNALAMIFLSLSLFGAYMVGIKSTNKDKAKSKSNHLEDEVNDNNDASTRSGCCQCCFKDVREINTIYTHEKIYDTIYPGLTAFMAIFTGFWWWEMAFSLYGNSAPNHHDHNNDHNHDHMTSSTSNKPDPSNDHTLHNIYGLVVKHMLLTLFVMLFLSKSLEKLDSILYHNQDPSRNTSDSQKSRIFSIVGNWIMVIAVLIVLSQLISIPSFWKDTFFYHVLFMTLAFLFFMGQGVFLITNNFSLVEKIVSFCCVLDSFKKKMHVINQSLATVLYTLGFIMIFTHVGSHDHHDHEHNNETSTNSAVHFESWHAKLGLITLCGLISQFVLGMTLYFYTQLGCNALFQLKKLSKIHQIFTLCFFSLGLFTIFLALVSFDLEWSIFSCVFLGLCLVIIFCTVIPHGLQLLSNNTPQRENNESKYNFE